MAAEDRWQAWLDTQFPGFLLPDALHHAVDPDVASRFLASLGVRPDHLRVLQGTALFAPPGRAAELRVLVHEQVPDLVQALPSVTTVAPRVWEGGFQGRLDVRATLSAHLAGRPTTFVTRSRRRSFDLPETVLLKAVMTRLRTEIRRLRVAGMLKDGAWSTHLGDLEPRLDRLLEGTVLRDVSDLPVDGGNIQAARSARHPAYGVAARWFARMRTAFDKPTAARTAQLLAEGALRPASIDTRFELAVVMRLVEALWNRVRRDEPERWSITHGLVRAKRADVATIERDDGTAISVFYNQVLLPRGVRDEGVRHYFGAGNSRLRPDVSLRVCRPGRPDRWVVIEVKHSDNPEYLRSGFSEAVLYRYEYAPVLTGRLKSLLVASGQVSGLPRGNDAVVAVGWDAWVPGDIADELLEGVFADPDAPFVPSLAETVAPGPARAASPGPALVHR